MSLFSFPSQVNERAARLVASAVATSLLVSFFFRWPAIFPILAAGFVARVGWGPRFSLLARASMAVAARAFEVKPVAGPPKRFAQGIGALCMTAATTLWVGGMPAAAWAVGGMVAVFATLEATVAFCAGCWMYGLLQRAGVFPPDACFDCAPSYLKNQTLPRTP